MVVAVLLSGSVLAQTPVEADMAAIPGGMYRIGIGDAPSGAGPAHEVLLAPFRIDRHEVTNGEFVAYLNTLEVTVTGTAEAGRARRQMATGRAAATLFSGGEDVERLIELDDEDARIGVAGGRFMPQPGFEQHPVTEVTWYGAREYCAWRGARLPTEVEWEAAARGKQQRTYPWGEEEPTPDRALFARRRGATEPVGRRAAGATPEGVHDLAGSLAEWTSSLYQPYPYDPNDGREDLRVTGERVTRGGDYVFDASASKLTGFFRGGFSRAPEHGHRHIGFRCAKP